MSFCFMARLNCRVYQFQSDLIPQGSSGDDRYTLSGKRGFMCFTQLPVGCITGAAALTPDMLAKAWSKFVYMYTYHAYRGVHTK